MAITPKPPRQRSATASSEDAATAFIHGAHAPAPTSEAKTLGKKPKKEPVIIRFDDTTLARLDAEAARLGLSRAAWVRMVVAERLE